MMTYPSLLAQFLREECTPHVRELICEAVANRDQARARQEFDFNRFNLVLDFESGMATVEDETDTTPAGSADVAIAELLKQLGC